MQYNINEFLDALCDIESEVSIISRFIADKLRLTIETFKVKLAFSDSTSRSSLGVINNLEVKIVNYIIRNDFHVLEMESSSMLSLLGRDFNKSSC